MGAESTFDHLKWMEVQVAVIDDGLALVGDDLDSPKKYGNVKPSFLRHHLYLFATRKTNQNEPLRRRNSPLPTWVLVD